MPSMIQSSASLAGGTKTASMPARIAGRTPGTTTTPRQCLGVAVRERVCSAGGRRLLGRSLLGGGGLLGGSLLRGGLLGRGLLGGRGLFGRSLGGLARAELHDDTLAALGEVGVQRGGGGDVLVVRTLDRALHLGREGLGV